MKKSIRRFLNRFGYDIIKTDDRHLTKSRTEKTVQVGKFLITMPANNIQLTHYKMYPHMNAQLGRLAQAIEKKYPGMTTVDVGANVGDTIAVLKSAVASPVIGIEGDEGSYQFLEKNARLFSQVYLVKTFLGEKKQEIKAELKREGWNAAIVPSEKGSTISFKTLDEVLGESQFVNHSIKLIKTDVEGFDTIVLRGAYETVRRHRPVLFFEYNRDEMKGIPEAGLPTLLSFADYGYDKLAFFDHNGRLLQCTSIKNQAEITDLHEYAIGKGNLLGYYDICIFPQEDGEIADAFFMIERKLRAQES